MMISLLAVINLIYIFDPAYGIDILQVNGNGMLIAGAFNLIGSVAFGSHEHGDHDHEANCCCPIQLGNIVVGEELLLLTHVTERLQKIPDHFFSFSLIVGNFVLKHKANLFEL